MSIPSVSRRNSISPSLDNDQFDLRPSSSPRTPAPILQHLFWITSVSSEPESSSRAAIVRLRDLARVAPDINSNDYPHFATLIEAVKKVAEDQRYNAELSDMAQNARNEISQQYSIRIHTPHPHGHSSSPLSTTSSNPSPRNNRYSGSPVNLIRRASYTPPT